MYTSTDVLNLVPAFKERYFKEWSPMGDSLIAPIVPNQSKPTMKIHNYLQDARLLIVSMMDHLEANDQLISALVEY